MVGVSHHHDHTPLPTLVDWFEEFPFSHGIRVEELRQDTTYTVRAALPGIRLADITVYVEHGVLTIAAKRDVEKDGNLSRSMWLPPEVQADAITASYGDGVVTVTAPYEEAAIKKRQIRIESNSPTGDDEHH